MATLCLPWWHSIGLTAGTLSSGCPTVNGNVQCAPEKMRANAEATLRSKGYLKPGETLSLEAYTLARYMTSEMGSGTPEDRVAVGEAAVNRARLEKKPSVLSILLYRQKPGHPNYGYYGPIHAPRDPATGKLPAPYGRWAATSRDPRVADALLARLILEGLTDNFAQGADDQADYMDNKNYADPSATIRRNANNGDYWVGFLPGVNHRNTFLIRHYGVKPDTIEGQALLARGLAAITQASPNWSKLPMCSGARGSVALGTEIPPIAVFGGLLGLGILAIAFVRRRQLIAV